MIRMSDVQHIEQAPAPGPSPLDVARLILAGFDRHYALFRYSAQRAKALFESGDWHGIQHLSRERIEYYDMRVRECATQLEGVLRGRPEGALGVAAANGGGANGANGATGTEAPALTDAQTAYWQQIKQEFVGLLGDHRQPECAETFFNSVSCRLLHRDYFHNDFLFVRPAVATDYLDSSTPSYRVYYPATDGLEKSLIRMVADFGLALPFEDLPRDTRMLARAAVTQLRQLLPRHVGRRIASDCQVHALGSLFFRNKGAYIVGRLINQTTV
ncbi:MAG TPA: bifunctional isocitrate dehydrogenase kinase/phosphatase, partial [Achromobacter sp.]|nr:bifunctional isocitrate dehydrogenase kinase/phosphatase [Achromobacter sp.]